MDLEEWMVDRIVVVLMMVVKLVVVTKAAVAGLAAEVEGRLAVVAVEEGRRVVVDHRAVADEEVWKLS